MPEPIELKRGYIDQEGNAHTQVTLRAPRMRDEVVAEREANEAGFDAGSAYFECAFIAQCVTSWGGIVDVKTNHVLELHRLDAQALREEIGRLETVDIEAQTSGNSSDGEG
jgi:hypothetical protein